MISILNDEEDHRNAAVPTGAKTQPRDCRDATGSEVTKLSTSRFSITDRSGNTRILSLPGREAWALLNLLDVGEAGLTAIERPGPRWSSYLHRLRQRGVVIETVTEAHDGPFAGHHARYIVRSQVARLSAVERTT